MLLLCSTARAAKTRDESQRTYWDEIMEAQAARTLYQGSVYLERQDYQEAIREFSKAVAAAPNDASARRMLGVAYYWTGLVDRAEGEFRESIRLEPENSQGHLLLGIAHAWKGDVEKAFDSFKEAQRLDPNRADIAMNLGSIQESLGMLPEALTSFRRAVELDGSQALYHFQLGMLYRRLGRDEDAALEFAEAVKKYPGYQDALLELGAAYERMGRPKEALDLFKKAVRLKTRDSVARFRYARALLLAQREKEARATLRDVFHLTPTDPSQGLALSVAYGGQSRGRPQEGGKDESKAGGSPKDKPKPQEQAPQAQQPSGPEGLLDVVARNLARVPLQQEAVLNVDLAFIPKPKLVRENVEEKSSSLKKALERAGKPPPSSSNVMVSRREYRLPAAGAGEREAEIKKILADVRGVLDGAPPGAETRFGMNLSFPEKASAALQPDQGNKSKVYYNPHDVGNDLGLWVMGTGWMGLVEEVLEGGSDYAAHPQSASWWVLEGIGLATLGQARDALDAFTRALELNPGEELAHLGRGVAMVIAGDEKGAVEAYRRALAINPKNKAASEGLKWLLRAPAK